MRWTIVKGTELSPSLVAAWHRVLVEAPHFESPSSRPSTCKRWRAYSRTSRSVSRARMVRSRPYFLMSDPSDAIATPVGRDLCDYQGIIHRSTSVLEPLEMLRGLGLRRWQFDHLFPLDEPLSEWC